MFTIKKFELPDLDQLLQLFHDTVHTINIKDYSKQQVNAWAPEHVNRDRWAHKLNNLIVYVAKIDDQIVGFGDATHEGYIDHLYTHKDFQGQGIASALLKKLEEELRVLNVTLVTTEASITAKPFFEKQGYIVVSHQDKMHQEIVFRNYLMSKSFN